jgi:hypothetical protein
MADRILDFTVPSGSPRWFAISVWLIPRQKAHSSAARSSPESRHRARSTPPRRSLPSAMESGCSSSARGSASGSSSPVAFRSRRERSARRRSSARERAMTSSQASGAPRARS